MTLARLFWPFMVVAYYFAWFWFIGGGLLINVLCLPLLFVPWRRRVAPIARGLLRVLFGAWALWMSWTGVLRVRWIGFDRKLEPGAIIIANHPTLVDAPVLMTRLPDAVCILKQALMSNPAMGTAAKLAGFIPAKSGIDLLHDVLDQLKSGCSLLIFPEGTRTSPGELIGPLKPGFALIASRSQAAVYMAVIRSTPGLVPKGRAWWRPPTVLPGGMTIRLQRVWPAGEIPPAAVLTQEVQREFLESLQASSS